jgi:hypothetical protein
LGARVGEAVDVIIVIIIIVTITRSPQVANTLGITFRVELERRIAGAEKVRS